MLLVEQLLFRGLLRSVQSARHLRAYRVRMDRWSSWKSVMDFKLFFLHRPKPQAQGGVLWPWLYRMSGRKASVLFCQHLLSVHWNIFPWRASFFFLFPFLKTTNFSSCWYLCCRYCPQISLSKTAGCCVMLAPQHAGSMLLWETDTTDSCRILPIGAGRIWGAMSYRTSQIQIF